MPAFADSNYFYGDMGVFVLWDGSHVVRTADIQDASPVWEEITGAITGTIYDVQYFFVDDETVGAWCMTSTAIYRCGDIEAATPSWTEVLTITTVRATAVAPASGNVIFASMTHAWGLPGHLCIALSLDTENDNYLHAYYWVTEDSGGNWTAVDMTAFTFGTTPNERCYYSVGRYGLDSYKAAPHTLWCGRSNGRTGTSNGDSAVFKSEDLGYTWTLEHSFANWNNSGLNPAILAPWPDLTSPSYLVRGTGGSTQSPKLFVSADAWDTATEMVEPAGHTGGFATSNHLQRVAKRPDDTNHILALFQIDASSNADLYESIDGGSNWALLQNFANSTVIPSGWPADGDQWVIVDNTDTPHVRLTLDNFATLLDKTGNLASVITWTNGQISGGFALPKANAAASLDASLTTFFRVQAARQSVFGTAVEPTFALPVRFEYTDGDVDQVAAWDAGLWTGSEIVERVARFAEFRLRGALFFELLPLLFAAGFAPMTPSGVGPYSYSGATDAASVGAPVPYTFRFGGNNGGDGGMVQVADAYLRELTLSCNLNTKAVTFDSQWFGAAVDDNSGAGYAPAAVTLPDGLRMVNGLLSGVGLQDAGASGGAFDALTALACSVVEWELVIDTGLRPAWAGDQNALTYCGVRHETPSLTWRPHIRTTSDNYALVLTKAQARTYQELQIVWGATNREWTLQVTGRWLGKLNGHDRNRGEVVMKPTFCAATPRDQTTTPHWVSWAIETGWEHP